jgi:hypothetical protein
MEKINRIKLQSIIVFVIFLICILSYYLINIIGVIPVYGKENRLISWLIILPLTIIGLILSINVIFNTIKNFRENFLYLVLVIPFLLYFVYFFIWL